MELKPGRALDQLVAEKVFGHKVIDTNGGLGRVDKYVQNSDGSLTLVPQYSTHIAAAWEIVEKVKETAEREHHPGSQYVVELIYLNDENSWTFQGHWYMTYDGQKDAMWDFAEEALTAPHAICLAALEAMSDSDQK